MPVQNRIADFHDDMIAWRRDLHANPELALDEHRTSAIVVDRLRAFGVDEVITGLAQTGVVGVIRGRDSGASGRAIGLRADMDALPIEEATGAPYASTVPGKMHACGHDGHTTMLLGAARYLAETRRFDGTVYCIFQPAEEHIGGGRLMVQEGLFDRCPMEQVFGLHNWPSLPAGVFGWRAGPIMAATSELTIVITGRGAHAAYPHGGVDPIVVASAIVSAFQSVVARTVDPLANAVLSITTIHAGNAFNVIPETATMTGTARWFDPRVGDAIEAQVQRLATGIAAGFGASADVRFVRGYPATVNDPDAADVARDAALAVAGDAGVVHLDNPTMGGEDFSFMLNAKRGAYLVLGSGRAGDNPGLHHPTFDFNDDILTTGASYWATLAERLLPAA